MSVVEMAPVSSRVLSPSWCSVESVVARRSIGSTSRDCFVGRVSGSLGSKRQQGSKAWQRAAGVARACPHFSPDQEEQDEGAEVEGSLVSCFAHRGFGARGAECRVGTEIVLWKEREILACFFGQVSSPPGTTLYA